MQLSKALKRLDTINTSFDSHSLDADPGGPSRQDSCERSTSYWRAYEEYMIKEQRVKVDMHLYKEDGLNKKPGLAHLSQLSNSELV